MRRRRRPANPAGIACAWSWPFLSFAVVRTLVERRDGRQPLLRTRGRPSGYPLFESPLAGIWRNTGTALQWRIYRTAFGTRRLEWPDPERHERPGSALVAGESVSRSRSRPIAPTEILRATTRTAMGGINATEGQPTRSPHADRTGATR